MADNIFSGLARGIQAGQQLGLQRQQLAAQQAQVQQAEDDRTFNRLVDVFSLIPKTDVASRQSILDQISEQSDGQIPKMNLEQGTTVMGILAPSLKDHAEGKITKDEVLSRVGVLGLERPTEAAGLEKFATGFEERGTTQELQQAQAISGLPEEQFIKGGGARAIAELRGRSPEGREILAEERKPGAIGKKAINLLIPSSNEIVISHDNGRTYLRPDGSTVAVPAEAIVVGGTTPLGEVRAVGFQREAQEELEAEIGKESKAEKTFNSRAEEAAVGGTGPWANLKAGFNAVFGGLGFDAAFGKEGFFRDTQENRQYLRVIKQTGKEALLNSARGATWEQEKIEQLFANPSKFWVDPQTEGRKFPIIRDIMLFEKEFNNKAILTAGPKEIIKLRDSNRKIDSLLNLLSQEAIGAPTAGGLSPEDDALINKYTQ